MVKTRRMGLMGVAALALMATYPAHAENAQTNIKARGDTATYTSYTSDEETITKQEVERTLEKAGDSIKRAANNVAEAVNVRPDAKNGDVIQRENTDIRKENSADFMIGKPVKNAGGEDIGSVYDLILSEDGSIDALIIASDGRMIFGEKKAVFDFDAINGRDVNGAVLTSLTEDQIKQARTFDYDVTAQADAQTQTKGETQISAREMIGTDIESPEGKEIGRVSDIALDNGSVSKVVIAYDQIFGLGGKKAAIDYRDLDVSSDGNGRPSIALSASQAAMLSGNL